MMNDKENTPEDENPMPETAFPPGFDSLEEILTAVKDSERQAAERLAKRRPPSSLYEDISEIQAGLAATIARKGITPDDAAALLTEQFQLMTAFFNRHIVRGFPREGVLTGSSNIDYLRLALTAQRQCVQTADKIMKYSIAEKKLQKSTNELKDNKNAS